MTHHEKQIFPVNINVNDIQVFSVHSPNDTKAFSDSVNYNRKEHFFSLKSYFLLGYYAGIIPFKPTYDTASARWRMKFWWFQKIVVCLCLVWIPCWIYQITEFPEAYATLTKLAKVSAKAHFLALVQLLHYIKIILFSWIIHNCSENIEEHFNCLNGSEVHFCPELHKKFSELRKSSRAKIYVKITTCLMYFVFLVATLYNMLVLNNVGDKSIFSNPWELFNVRIQTGKRRFFIYENQEGWQYSAWKIVLGCLEVWLKFAHLWALMGLQSFYFGCYPLTIWTAVKNFSNYVHTSLTNQTGFEGQDQIIAAFSELQKFSMKLNSTWGILHLVMVLENVMGTIFTLKGIEGNAVYVALAYFIMLYWLLSMLASGDVYRMMICVHSKLRVWTKQHILVYGKSDPRTVKMEMLVSDISNAQIGIGTEGVYRYDFNFISELLVVTIGLFILSFEDGK